MNWYQSCACNDTQKRAFHATGRQRLKALATALGFEPGSYDLRSNPGGIAVMWNVKPKQSISNRHSGGLRKHGDFTGGAPVWSRHITQSLCELRHRLHAVFNRSSLVVAQGDLL